MSDSTFAPSKPQSHGSSSLAAFFTGETQLEASLNGLDLASINLDDMLIRLGRKLRDFAELIRR